MRRSLARNSPLWAASSSRLISPAAASSSTAASTTGLFSRRRACQIPLAEVDEEGLLATSHGSNPVDADASGTRAPVSSSSGLSSLSSPSYRAQVPTSVPSYLSEYLPPAAQTAILGPTAPPLVVRLPPAPTRRQAILLSKLDALLSSYPSWRQHALVIQYYHALEDDILTPAVHRLVALTVARGPAGSRETWQRLDSVVRRCVNLGIEIDEFAQAKYIRGARNHGQKQHIGTSSSANAGLEAWNVLHGDADKIIRSSESASASTSLSRAPPRAVRALLKRSHAPQIFQNLLSHIPASKGIELPSVVAAHARQYTLMSNLPALLQPGASDDPARFTVVAFNEVLRAFAADPNISLAVPLEAYVALRRNAAGLKWRRPYLDRASKGLYQNYEDPMESFANPILDSLGYYFPKGMGPNRDTYSLLLEACVQRGDLNLALVIFKDMLNPNGMSLRMPGSPPGPKFAPPVKLPVYSPLVSDYSTLFSGFITHGETEGLPRSLLKSYDPSLRAITDPSPPSTAEELAALERQLASMSGLEGTDAPTDPRLAQGNAFVRVMEQWEIGMGARIDPVTLKDPYIPGFKGEAPQRNQYAVNVATQKRKWSLPTLVILFRSYLGMLPVPDGPESFNSSLITSTVRAPHPGASAAAALPPSDIAPSAHRIEEVLRAFGQTTNWHPVVLKEVWEALEDKFGQDNLEGWHHFRLSAALRDLLTAVHISPAPSEAGKKEESDERWEDAEAAWEDARKGRRDGE